MFDFLFYCLTYLFLFHDIISENNFDVSSYIRMYLTPIAGREITLNKAISKIISKFN